MKNLLITITACFILLCSPSGTTTYYPVNDALLPEELKGLKIYNVAYREGSYIQIAVRNKEIIATSYSVGKSYMSLSIIDENNSVKTITIKEIISETDSIIVARK